MKTLTLIGLIAAFLGFWAMQAKKPLVEAPSTQTDVNHR